MKTNIGDIVKVKINGKKYDSIIDSDNVQRFVTNTLIRHLVDTQIDLNKLCIDYHNGKFTLDEYMEFYIGMGYSLCGFDEIFGCNGNLEEKDQAKINNPIWK